MSTVQTVAKPVVPAPTSGAHKLKNFLIGGMSGIVATTFVSHHLISHFLLQVQPIDLIKVRIQILAGENPGKTFGPVDVAKDIFKNDGGFKGFYKGIDSAYMRQAVYTTARFGIFLNLTEYVKQKNGG